MKKLIACAAVIALAGCGGEAEPEAETPEMEAPEQAATEDVARAIDGGPLAGTYDTVDVDGNESVWTLNDDGTFTLETAGEDPVSGTYTNVVNDDGGTFCADPEGEEAGETCFAISQPGEDGTWTATDPDGNVLKASRAAQ